MGKSLWFKHVYTKQLIYFLCITIIPCLLLSAITYQVSIANAKNQAKNYSSQLLNMIQSSNDTQVEAIQGFVYDLMLNFDAYSEILQKAPYTSDVLSLYTALEKKKVAKQQVIKNFYLVDIRSKKVYASDKSSIYAFDDFSDSNLLHLLFNQPQALAYNDLIPRQNVLNEEVASYIVRYPLAGDIHGYVVIDVDLDNFTYKDRVVNENYGSLLIQNSNNRLLTTAHSALLPRILNGESSEYLTIRSKSKFTGLQYLYAIPQRLIKQKNQFLLASIFILCALFVLIGGLLAWIGSRNVYTPLRNLLLNIKQLIGDKEAPPNVANEYSYLQHVITSINMENKEYQDAFKTNGNIFKQKQLSYLLNGKSDGLESIAVPEKLRLHLPHACYMVMVFEIEEIQVFKEKYTSLEQELMLFAIENIAEEVLQEFCEAFATHLDPYRIVVLLNVDDSKGLEAGYEDLGRNVQSQVQRYLNFHLSVGIGNMYPDINAVALSYEQALRAVSYKVYYGKGSITHYLNVAESSTVTLNNMSWSDVKSQLTIDLQSCDWEQIEASMEGIVQKATYLSITETDLQFMFIHYAACLSEACADFSLQFSQVFGTDFRLDATVKQITTLEDMKLAMTDLLRKLHERIKKTKDNIHQELIEKVLLYIQSNLDTNLTLESIAEKVYMHPAYLSRICKALTGKGLGEQIVLARVHKAKELLALTQTSVNEIASRVGYTNPRAFYRLFKEYTGLTPGEFRKNEGLKNVQ